LFDYECHFARYGEGAFYKKHLDAFKTPEESHLPKRLLSSVLYLNRDWGNEDGGELLLYPPQDENTLSRWRWLPPSMGALWSF
jgi:SM-20-related protein